MNILIISTNRTGFPVPVLPAGACMIAEAAERAGQGVTFLDLMFLADPLRAVKTALERVQYDVIGLSVRNIDNIDMGAPRYFIGDLIALVGTIRRMSDAHLVLGGTAVMIMPEEIMRATGVTSAVVADGETVFPRLVEKLALNGSGEDLPGVASLVGEDFRVNPAESGCPHPCAAPDYDRWLDMRAYNSHLATVPLQTKRGCSFQCVYCTYRKIEGVGYRLSEPDDVADVVLRYASSGSRDIEFVDNVFNAPYDHALTICESLIRSKHGARLQSIEMSPLSLDHRLLTTMERAGFVGMGLTVESASDPVLAGLRKGFTTREVHTAAEVVKQGRLPCLWIFLLGGPGETRDTVRETLRFAEKFITPRDAALFNIGIRIYPGTVLEEIARRQGVLSVPPCSMLAPFFYVSPEVEPDWIMGEVRRSMSSHMNFMNADSMSFPYLPHISRLGHRLGLKPPLWRYTRFIRGGLRSIGMQV